MISFSDLKYMYTHPRVRVVQGKAKESLKPEWDKVKVTITQDYKSQNKKTSYGWMSVYRDDLEKFLDENPSTMIKLQLPKALALIMQSIINQNSDDDTYVWVTNHAEYAITVLVKEKRLFNKNFVHTDTEDVDNRLRPQRLNILKSMMRDLYNITDLEDYRFYSVLNTAGIEKYDTPIDLSEQQVNVLNQLCLYKRVHHVQLPININRSKILSFINVGVQLWDK